MDDEARELLAGFVRGQTPSASRKAQAWETIQGRIALGDVGPLEPEGASAAGASGKLALAVVIGGIAVLVAYGAGFIGGDSRDRGESLPSHVEVPSAEAVAPAPIPEPSEPPTTVAREAVVPIEPVGRAPASPRPKRSTRAKAESVAVSPPVEPTSTLSEEVKLLRRAWTQLQKKAFSKALATLAEHKRRFPRGALAAERQIRTAEVHCKRGAPKAARRVVESFLRAHPQTTLRTRALGICKAPPEDQQ